MNRATVHNVFIEPKLWASIELKITEFIPDFFQGKIDLNF